MELLLSNSTTTTSSITTAMTDSFPVRLYHMLEDAAMHGFDHVVTWLPKGDGFVIRNRTILEGTILKTYFAHSQWKSFLRQLNMYSFQRLSKRGQDMDCYAHPCLVRGDLAKCKFILRQPKKTKGLRPTNCPSSSSSSFTLPPPPTTQSSNTTSQPPILRLDAKAQSMRFRGCSFPVRLYHMLEDATSNQALGKVVAWLPNGNGFVIRDRTAFEGNIMKTYFAHTQWTSFLRQLNMYSFQRLSKRGEGMDSYAHPCLQRGDISKCNFMMRRPKSTKTAKSKSNSKPMMDTPNAKNNCDSDISYSTSSLPPLQLILDENFPPMPDLAVLDSSSEDEDSFLSEPVLEQTTVVLDEDETTTFPLQHLVTSFEDDETVDESHNFRFSSIQQEESLFQEHFFLPV